METFTEPRVLEFPDPTIQPGMNLTVRKGTKWADAKPGDVLFVKRTGELPRRHYD